MLVFIWGLAPPLELLVATEVGAGVPAAEALITVDAISICWDDNFVGEDDNV